MMKRTQLLLLLSGVMLQLLIVTCTKEDNEVEPELPLTPQKLKIAESLVITKLPEVITKSENQFAVQLKTYFEKANSLNDYAPYLNPPESSDNYMSHQGKNEWTYRWKYGSNTIWTIYSESYSTNRWQIDIDHGSGRKKIVVAEEEKSGYNGWMKILNQYSLNYEYTYILEYSWQITDEGGIKLIMKSSLEKFKIDLQLNHDKSGSVRYYDNDQLHYKFSWHANGSGSYVLFAEGVQQMSGSWSVSDL